MNVFLDLITVDGVSVTRKPIFQGRDPVAECLIIEWKVLGSIPAYCGQHVNMAVIVITTIAY